MIHNRLSGDVPTPAARSKRRVTMGMVGVILAAGAATAGTGTALATSASPVGKLDGLVVSADRSTWTLSGWAIDYKTPTSPIDVHIYLDGSYVTATAADGPRTDLSAATVAVAGADHGFGVSITAPTTVGTHYACAYAIDSGGVGPNPLIGCRKLALTTATATTTTTTTTTGSEAPTVTVAATALPLGRIDHLMVSADKSTWTLTGWAVDYKTPTSAIDVHTYVDGAYVTATTADAATTDLTGAALAVAGADHGFSVSVPASTTVGTHYVCEYAINSTGTGPNPLMGCRKVVVAA